MEAKYYRVCRVRCRLCGTVLEYRNRSKHDRGPGRPMMCSCGKVGLDPSACLYRVLGELEHYEDLSEEWEEEYAVSNNPYPVGPGWWPLLDETVAKLRVLDPEVQLLYKEKYGTCQIDFITESSEHFNEINKLTADAEVGSGHICEFCGQPGQLREERVWMQTLCDRCAELDPLERRKVAQETREQYFRKNE